MSLLAFSLEIIGIPAVVACFLRQIMALHLYTSALPWARTFCTCLGTALPQSRHQLADPNQSCQGWNSAMGWMKPSLWVQQCWCVPLASPAVLQCGLPCLSKSFQYTSPNTTQRLLSVVLLTGCIYLEEGSKGGRWLFAAFICLNALLTAKQINCIFICQRS